MDDFQTYKLFSDMLYDTLNLMVKLSDRLVDLDERVHNLEKLVLATTKNGGESDEDNSN